MPDMPSSALPNSLRIAAAGHQLKDIIDRAVDALARDNMPEVWKILDREGAVAVRHWDEVVSGLSDAEIQQADAEVHQEEDALKADLRQPLEEPRDAG